MAVSIVLSTAEFGDTLFKPEESLNYEIGIKSSWFERRLNLNLSCIPY